MSNTIQYTATLSQNDHHVEENELYNDGTGNEMSCTTRCNLITMRRTKYL